MAYYTALQTAWNGATQPPAGVTGTALTGGMTTTQKIAAVNGWTVAVATRVIVPTYQIYNRIVASEFSALTAANQALVNTILGLGQADLGTSDLATTTNIRDNLAAIFGMGSTTRSQLLSLVQGFQTTEEWWRANGYLGPINLNDVNAAGLS